MQLCSSCNKIIDGKYAIYGKLKFHIECTKELSDCYNCGEKICYGDKCLSCSERIKFTNCTICNKEKNCMNLDNGKRYCMPCKKKYRGCYLCPLCGQLLNGVVTKLYSFQPSGVFTIPKVTLVCNQCGFVK
jgi:hypothetical protein